MLGRREVSRGEGAHWLIRAVTAGFVGTATMTVSVALAYWLALSFGRPEPEAPLLLRWTWALANNVVTRDVATSLPLAALLHILAGIGWAVIYTRLVEARLRGAGWRRGAIFSLVPWTLSLVVFLPIVGGGFFGAALGAGPLPAFGNLVLHLVYGVVLGQLSLPASDLPTGERYDTVSPEELSLLLRAGRTTATGIVLGLVVGALLGVVVDATLIREVGPLLASVFGAIVGSAIGALVGSFWGLSPQSH